jgi:hypothetical protein
MSAPPKGKAAPVGRGGPWDQANAASGRWDGRASVANGLCSGLHEWARRHAVHLADCFMFEAADKRGDPKAYFEAHSSPLARTQTYRPTAEAAFHARVLELEGRQ